MNDHDPHLEAKLLRQIDLLYRQREVLEKLLLRLRPYEWKHDPFWYEVMEAMEWRQPVLF